jgi:CHAT domain-containing protein
VWAADDRGTEFKWISVPAEKLSRLCRRFARECSDPAVPEAEVRITGRELYGALFGTLTNRLRGRKLLIETDGEIGSIPFEALVEPNGAYLNDSHALVYSPGFRHWLRMQQSTSVSPRAAALIVTAPRVSGRLATQFPPLLDARNEGEMVASVFSSSTTLTGADATLPRIVDGLGRVEVFHFSGHGVSNSDGGGLLLASTDPAEDAALLTAGSLSGQQMSRCRLAVLSACSTGVGESRGPVNPSSLVNAFLRAGVRDVVASRWRVDSASTAALMRQFYSRLSVTGQPSTALQLATRDMRNETAMSHPYYWSAFSVFGE